MRMIPDYDTEPRNWLYYEMHRISDIIHDMTINGPGQSNYGFQISGDDTYFDYFPALTDYMTLLADFNYKTIEDLHNDEPLRTMIHDLLYCVDLTQYGFNAPCLHITALEWLPDGMFFTSDHLDDDKD
jgi:hypothetical protein